MTESWPGVEVMELAKGAFLGFQKTAIADSGTVNFGKYRAMTIQEIPKMELLACHALGNSV